MTEKNSGIRKNSRLLFSEMVILKKINNRELPNDVNNKCTKNIHHIPYATSKGTIYIFYNAPLNAVHSLKISARMGNFFKNFKDPARETKKMLENLAEENIVSIVYTEENEIIGYITVVKPEEKEFNFDNVYQIGAIEIASEYRKLGIAMELMKIFEDNFFDDKIVYASCYSWHWDITGCTKKEYREKLLNLLHSQCFVEEYIDEINIKMDPYNIFSVRYGKKANSELIKKFKGKLFKKTVLD